MDEVSILMDASKRRNEAMYPDLDKKGKTLKAPPKRQSLDDFASELGV